MEHHKFNDSSEMVSLAVYNTERKELYLTFIGGGTTIAYHNISPALFEELKSSTYPDVCVRFKIQAKHSFRRVDPVFESLGPSYLK